MDPDDREFLLSQYADNTLDPGRVAAVEAMLRVDPDARAMLQEHRDVTDALRAGTALPPVRWERLAQAMSAHIDRADQAHERAAFRMPVYLRWAAGAAVAAACVVVALLLVRGAETDPTRPMAAGEAKSIVVMGPMPDARTAGASVIQVSVAPPAGFVSGLAGVERQADSPRILVAGAERTVTPDPFSGQ